MKKRFKWDMQFKKNSISDLWIPHWISLQKMMFKMWGNFCIIIFLRKCNVEFPHHPFNYSIELHSKYHKGSLTLCSLSCCSSLAISSWDLCSCACLVLSSTVLFSSSFLAPFNSFSIFSFLRASLCDSLLRTWISSLS